jgi:UDP-N-acetyl-D-galactosamine dehydrogenase
MKINISIIGLGYVGLPLLVELNKYFHVIGYDTSSQRINELKKFLDITKEIPTSKLKKINNYKFTSDFNDIKNSNFYIVTVPTPIFINKKPDLSNIISATKLISKFLKKNDTVVYESTVYPGVTEDLCGKILEKETNLILNKDFSLGYSPERINPGDKKKKLQSIIKVISASNSKALKLISFVYSKIVKAGIFEAESIKIAEAAKVIENTQRDLNIALTNEFKIIFDKMKIDFFKILKTASTKWNFLNFSPGMVGGHCIGVDPYYLTYISKKNRISPKVILSGRNINDNMWKYYYNKIQICINSILNTKSLRILILGVTFKENCPDFRNSQVIKIIKKLSYNKHKFDIYDPIVNSYHFEKQTGFSLKTNKSQLNKYDIFFISVGHDVFKKNGLNFLKKNAKKKYFIIDIKNTFKKGELIES